MSKSRTASEVASEKDHMSRRTASSRKRTHYIGMICIAILGSLISAEVGARIYAAYTGRVRGTDYDKDYGWKPLPNVVKRDKWVASLPARTNSHGWRDREHSYQKLNTTRRVVAIGDSFTFGWRMDYGHRFTEVLEQLDPSLEVINLGMHAYGTDQELLVYEREGWRYDPDVVLLSVFAGTTSGN